MSSASNGHPPALRIFTYNFDIPYPPAQLLDRLGVRASCYYSLAILLPKPATMTRLQSDSFLPSGALDSDQHLHLSLADFVASDASSSVISPLSLPGAVHYFDPAPRPSVTSHPNTLANHAYPHLNGTSRDPPQAQPATFFSPHLTPIPSHAQRQLQFQRQPQQRSASLSPTRRSPAGRYATMEGKRTTDVDLSPRFTSGVSVPVDTISGTGSGVVTVRRTAMRTFSPETASIETQSSSLEYVQRLA